MTTSASEFALSDERGGEGDFNPTTQATERAAGEQLVEDAYAYLATHLELDRDRHYLFSADNQAVVMFDRDVAARNGELFLTSVDVAAPGRGLGSRIIDALHAFANNTGTVVFVGPCVNPRYWKASDGAHPDRHPWLTYAGDEHGEPIYSYSPATTSSCVRDTLGARGRHTSSQGTDHAR